MVDKGHCGKPLRLYFLDVKRRLLAGGVAATSASMPDAVRGGEDDGEIVADLDRFQLCTATQPLTAREFLTVKQFPADVASEFERDLMTQVSFRRIGGGFFRHASNGRWVFRREALEAW